jgi:hypothetical protein
MHDEILNFFTTNVRLVTTLDDLRFMTFLPVVNPSCRRYLILFSPNARSTVCTRCCLSVATGMNPCKGVYQVGQFLY